MKDLCRLSTDQLYALEFEATNMHPRGVRPRRNTNTMWVASPWGFSEKTIQPARHECHARCLLRAGFLAFQTVVDNTCGPRVEQVVSSFQKLFRGSQLTWYSTTLEWKHFHMTRVTLCALCFSSPAIFHTSRLSYSVLRFLRRPITKTKPY